MKVLQKIYTYAGLILAGIGASLIISAMMPYLLIDPFYVGKNLPYAGIGCVIFIIGGVMTFRRILKEEETTSPEYEEPQVKRTTEIQISKVG